MSFIKEIYKLLRKNWKTLVAFQVIYQLTTSLVFLPLITGGVNVIMRIRGYRYLTAENVFAFVGHPLSILLLGLLVFVVTWMSMTDIVAMIFILDQSKQNQTVNLIQVFKYVFRNSAKAAFLQSPLLPIMVLLLMPFLNIGLAAGVISSLPIPDFVMEAVESNWVYLLILIAGVIYCMVIMMRWIFSLHYFVLEEDRFSKAQKRSIALGRGQNIRNLFVLLFVQAVIFVVYALALIVLLVLLLVLDQVLITYRAVNILTSSLIWLVFIAIFALSGVFGIPLGYAIISEMYYRRKEKIGEPIIHSTAPSFVPRPRVRKFLRISGVLLGIGLLVLNMFMVNALYYTGLHISLRPLQRIEVTAHRGASNLYPENTMAAFVGAAELGADWIELDVQQSKDGQIYVAHDTNFKRITGVDANCWELTYDEIAQLDAGSYFSEEFAGERMPLLTEVIEWAAWNKIKLNIELKPTGHETDFEKTVADIIREYHFENQCVVTSQVYTVLEAFEEYDPELYTVYVMSFAYGNISALTAADGFSVESSSISRNLVRRVHRAGKQIYAWTVNSESAMNKMVQLNVDNIITDDVETAMKYTLGDQFSQTVQMLAEEFDEIREEITENVVSGSEAEAE